MAPFLPGARVVSGGQHLLALAPGGAAQDRPARLGPQYGALRDAGAGLRGPDVPRVLDGRHRADGAAGAGAALAAVRPAGHAPDRDRLLRPGLRQGDLLRPVRVGADAPPEEHSRVDTRRYASLQPRGAPDPQAGGRALPHLHSRAPLRQPPPDRGRGHQLETGPPPRAADAARLGPDVGLLLPETDARGDTRGGGRPRPRLRRRTQPLAGREAVVCRRSGFVSFGTAAAVEGGQRSMESNSLTAPGLH